MQLKSKTLEMLREIINGDGTAYYRSGPQLVEFFNTLGSKDTYGQGFPSRWRYTDEKLSQINGTSDMDKCIRKVLAVEDYIENIAELDSTIERFNKYLAFDKWKVVRDNDTINFERVDRLIIPETSSVSTEMDEEEAFLGLTFDIDINLLGLDLQMSEIIMQRLKEVEYCVNGNAPLAGTILIGSIMEGILLGIAAKNPRDFNQANSAPKENGSVRRFPDWTLSNLIDAASELGILKPDVKKFSHAIRDFRNYIHPYMQMQSQFTPDKQTAMICLQVLKAALFQIGNYNKTNNGGVY